MLAESKTISGAGTYSTTWAYNAADLPVSMTYPGDGETVAFDYNDRMLPEKLRDTRNTPGNPADDSFYVSSTIYDLAGRITSQTLGNGVMRNYQYFKWNTQGGRLEKMAAGTGAWDNASFNFTNNLQKLTYAYDPVGNITQITNNLTSVDEKQIYKYDKLDRLRCWGLTTRTGTSQCDTYVPASDSFSGALSGGDEEYRYDPATGSLDVKAGVDLNYNDTAHKHAVTHIGTAQKYWYDANGNQIKRIVGPDTYDLVYDAENRLSQVKKNSTVIATFIYDGDGNRVKSVMGSETTVFIGGYYEVTNPGSGQTVTKYYFAGAQRVAMKKIVIPQSETLTYLLGDHLGSTSLAVDASDTDFSDIVETRYKPWGEVRFTTDGKTLPTRYTYTGQYSHVSDSATDLGSAGFGLLFYNARWMDPALGRFIQADTIVPGGVQGLDRYAYVNNNPIRYTDPSGHQCTPEDECDTPHGDLAFVPSGRPPLLKFSTDEGQEFTAEEKEVFNAGAWDIAKALAREANASCNRVDRKMGVCSFLSPSEAFHEVFGGPISVRRVQDECGCWAMRHGKDADGLYEIWVYSSTSTQEILEHPNLIVHEIGHAFYWAAGGFVEGSSVGERNGFYGPYFKWQFGIDTRVDFGTEIFADMFLGWVYGKWEPGEVPGRLSINGQYKSDYMDKYMPLMIDKAVGR